LEEVVFKIRKPLTKAERKAFEPLRNGGAAGPVGRPEITWSQKDLKWAEEKGMTEADLVSLIGQDRVDLEADSVREPGDYADLVSGRGRLLKWDQSITPTCLPLQSRKAFRSPWGSTESPLSVASR
jgi:hypothetical protein